MTHGRGRGSRPSTLAQPSVSQRKLARNPFPVSCELALSPSPRRPWERTSRSPGVRGDDEPIIGPTSASTLHLWGPKQLKPKFAAVLGRSEGVNPYLLRHSHASLLPYCAYTVPSAAARMGHAATEHLSTGAHAIKALKGQTIRYADLDAAISAARAEPGVLLGFPPLPKVAILQGT